MNHAISDAADESAGGAALNRALYTLTLLFLVAMSICLFTLDRGFDITDESDALLLAIYPHIFRIFVSASHWITSQLWALTGSLAFYRASGLFILLGGATVLAAGAMRAGMRCGLAVSGTAAQASVIVTTLLVALHFDCYGAMLFFSPNYNLLAISGSYMALGLTLLAVGCHGTKEALLRFLTGGVLGVVFLCKFPAGVNVSLLVVLVAVAMEERPVSRWFAAAAPMAAGAIAMFLLALWPQMSLTDAVAEFHKGLSIYGITVHESPGQRMARYAQEMGRFAVDTGAVYGTASLLFAVYTFFRRRIIAYLALLLLAATLALKGWWIVEIQNVLAQMSALFALCFITLIVAVPHGFKGRRQSALSLALLLLPYCIAIGTGNALPPHVIVSLASWGVWMTLLAFTPPVYGRRAGEAKPLCLLLAVTCTLHLVASAIFPGYHLDEGMIWQTETIDIPRLGMLRVDKGTRSFVQALQQAARQCQIPAGQPFVGLYNDLGAALVIQGIPVLTPWLAEPAQAQTWLAAVPQETLARSTVALMLTPGGNIPPLPAALPEFPGHYRLCGEAVYPYQRQRIQLWAPKK